MGRLISNAIRHSEKDSTIRISVSYSTKIIGFVTFSVIDSGPGVSESAKKNLFKPVVQILPVDLLRGKESGMGLAICTDIVALHEGSMGYESTFSNETGGDGSVDSGGRGRGSEFFFNILFKVCHETESDVEEE